MLRAVGTSNIAPAIGPLAGANTKPGGRYQSTLKIVKGSWRGTVLTSVWWGPEEVAKPCVLVFGLTYASVVRGGRSSSEGFDFRTRASARWKTRRLNRRLLRRRTSGWWKKLTSWRELRWEQRNSVLLSWSPRRTPFESLLQALNSTHLAPYPFGVGSRRRSG